MIKQLVVFTSVLLALASSTAVFTCPTFGLKSVHGKFLSAQPNGNVQWNRDWYRTLETIRFEQSGSDPDTGSFKSYHGKYLAATTSHTLEWNRDWKRSWELFTIEQHGDKVAIKTPHGRYISAQADGSVDADRTWKRTWELFTVYPPSCLRCQCDGTITNTDYNSTNVQYHLLNLDHLGTSFVAQPRQHVASIDIDNRNSTDQQSSTFTASRAVTNTKIFTRTYGLSVMVGAEFKAGIPFVASGKIEVTGSESFTHGIEESTTETISAEYT